MFLTGFGKARLFGRCWLSKQSCFVLFWCGTLHLMLISWVLEKARAIEQVQRLMCWLLSLVILLILWHCWCWFCYETVSEIRVSV